jgi:hypothetical protein
VPLSEKLEVERDQRLHGCIPGLCNCQMRLARICDKRVSHALSAKYPWSRGVSIDMDLCLNRQYCKYYRTQGRRTNPISSLSTIYTSQAINHQLPMMAGRMSE